MPALIAWNVVQAVGADLSCGGKVYILLLILNVQEPDIDNLY